MDMNSDYEYGSTWIHRYEFMMTQFEFTIELIYMNSDYEFGSTWIHRYEFIKLRTWIQDLWIHSTLWIHSLWIHRLWIHTYEFKYFRIHIWIHSGQGSRCGTKVAIS